MTVLFLSLTAPSLLLTWAGAASVAGCIGFVRWVWRDDQRHGRVR